MNDMQAKRELAEATHRIVNSYGPNMPEFAKLIDALAWLLSEWTGVTVRLQMTAEGQSESLDMQKTPNAALNLKRLATATALPVASPSGNGGAAAERVSAVVGKVTPVRDDGGHQDPSGQEENRAHFCALSR